MVKAVRFNQLRGSDVLEIADLPDRMRGMNPGRTQLI